MGLNRSTPAGATPLTAEDIVDLIPSQIATRDELDEVEEINIDACRDWLRTARARFDPLDMHYLLELHRRMFDRTWRWAGVLRQRETNLGVAPARIATDLRQLLDNIRFRLDAKREALEDVAIEYHHRLVAIHPFANGNGRHARFATNLLLDSRGERAWTWGSETLAPAGPVRDRYLQALRKADAGDYTELKAFARS